MSNYYCCFCCPTESYIKHNLNELCSNCKRPYGFPLFNPPRQIGEYRIVKPLARGFYAATYLAEWGNLNQKRVLKVVSKKVYTFFKKDFAKECELHNRVAEGTDHVVPIENYSDADVLFGDTELACHIAILGYAGEDSLGGILEEKRSLPAKTVAQIAIDLYRIFEELSAKRIRHNDLHAGNIMIAKLSEDTARADVLDPTIRAVAVDLGSLSEESKSDSREGRLGDIHQVAGHLRKLVESLLGDPDKVSDLDFRIATLLESHSFLLAPPAETQRPPKPGELAQDIRVAFWQVSAPWRETLKLRSFDDAYNAQTLAPWFVPHLLVDPEGKWVSRMSTHGSQIITGMRGCGKTMLLRALQFHARATARGEETEAEILTRLSEDGFIGLYVSCTRLLDTLGTQPEDVESSFERLFTAYALESMQAIRHLREIDKGGICPFYYKAIAEVINDCLQSPVDWMAISSESELERALLRILVFMRRGKGGYKLRAEHPYHAFEHLADALRRCSSVWNNAYVLYLLDDVSTRYLGEEVIRKIISALIFQSAQCAFKLTTEVQTLELAIRSPGGIESARQGRDYDVFDLGAEVYEITGGRNKKLAKEFLINILTQRAHYYPAHPQNVSPATILGDATLKSIASKIVSTSDNSSEKKKVYHGISALANVCVGDIGDVISIYELILRRGTGARPPVRQEIQSQCYQDFCTRRIYDLNRRDSDLKDFALSFAEAAHELLVKSYRQIQEGKNHRERLRQYSKVYVRVTKGDTRWQFQRLRKLIDAGVFVLQGGSQTPRTKTRDSDPIQQFVLTYRKLFGLSNFIGLADRDRFELSGEQLEDWLRKPDRGKETLLRNLGAPLAGEGEPLDDAEEPEGDVEAATEEIQGERLLFDIHPTIGKPVSNGTPGVGGEYGSASPPPITVSILKPEDLNKVDVDVVVFGLGFEERTLESARRALDCVKPKNAILIQYADQGRAAEITKVVETSTKHCEVVDYMEVVRRGLTGLDGDVLVDITGLAKPVIFHAVREALKKSRKVYLCHTRAEQYYPLDENISEVLDAQEKRNHYVLTEQLKKILTGEKSPYEIDALLESDSDESRRRVLCAFSSPKHERLLSLLDKRQYDRIHLAVSPSDRPRSRLARLAADIAASNFNANVHELDEYNLESILRFVTNSYRYWYVQRGFNFECGLTGSKIQAVACAAASAVFKFSQCWYVRPKEFDPNRFTTGVADTDYSHLALT